MRWEQVLYCFDCVVCGGEAECSCASLNKEQWDVCAHCIVGDMVEMEIRVVILL